MRGKGEVWGVEVLSGGEGRRGIGIKRDGRARKLEASRAVEPGSVSSDHADVSS